MNEKITLICTSVRFYTQNDETLFFEWIQKISCIKKYEGIGRELHLHIKKKDISDGDLRDLIGLFFRYKVDMKQLQIFLNETNKEWFHGGTKRFWHKRIWS